MSSAETNLPASGVAAPAGDHADSVTAGDRGVWVYAVASGIDPDWLGGLTGAGGNPVRVVGAAGLAAAVSTVSLADFGEAALRRNLEDLAWLEAVARIHHDVIEAVARHGPVVPTRLATVYRGDDGVAAMLVHRQEDLATALARVAGRTEWGVKVFTARPAAAGSSPDPAGPSPGQGPGAAFLRKRRAELAASQDAAQAAMDTAGRIHQALGQMAAASLLRPPQDPQLTGRPERMILNAAYLVDDRTSARFTAEAANLASQHQKVRVELTGPWPPYSFTVTEGSAEPGPASGQPVQGREAAR